MDEAGRLRLPILKQRPQVTQHAAPLQTLLNRSARGTTTGAPLHPGCVVDLSQQTEVAGLPMC
jgi:hypothetical protein